MNNIPDIGLINAHTESNRGDNLISNGTISEAIIVCTRTCSVVLPLDLSGP